jgi:hypothetical protein
MTFPLESLVRSRTIRQSGVQFWAFRTTTVPLGRTVLTRRVVQATFSVRLGAATDWGANRALAGSGAITKSALNRAIAPMAKYFKVILLNQSKAAGTKRVVAGWEVWCDRTVNSPLDPSLAAGPKN